MKTIFGILAVTIIAVWILGTFVMCLFEAAIHWRKESD